MVEVWTAPFVATTGEIIASSDANAGYRGNLLYLRQFLSANPAGANLALISTGVNGAGFSAIPDAAMANAKVSKSGDTMSGNLTVTGIVTGTTTNATGNMTAGGNIASTGGAISAAGNIAAGSAVTAATGMTAGGNITSTGGGVIAAGQLTSQQATGTPPLVVASTTQVANLNAATAGNATNLGGVAASGYARIASGSYTGDGTHNRQVTTGFVCKYVIVTGVDSGWNTIAHLISTSNFTTNAVVNASGTTCTFAVSDETKLHASDGFIVDATGTNAVGNHNGTPYKYVAFG